MTEGNFNCYVCGEKSVIWDCDYDAEDFGYDYPGIVSCYHCINCGAEITVDMLEKEGE